jgi:hypothetical protein
MGPGIILPSCSRPTEAGYFTSTAWPIIRHSAQASGFIWNFNVTSIGGILRTSQGNWITGLIDEVAVWKRALTRRKSMM